MKNTIACLILFAVHLPNTYAQITDSVIVYKELSGVVVDQFFQNNYNLELQRLRKVYPMALKAKAIIQEYEHEIAQIESKRQKKRYSKKMNKFLKNEFSYSIRDLYISEGRLLLQLIHKETNYTVDEILSLYATSMQAFMYRRMANLFKHDLNAKYDPLTTNRMTEIVLNDILSEKIEFNVEMERMGKEAFKASKKEYKKLRKEYRNKSEKK